MSQQQSLADQLGWCNTTQYHLNNLNMELKSVARQYRSSIDNLREFGYIAEMMPHLESLCSEFEESINSVVNYIESEHIEYVYNRSKTIQDMLSNKLG